MKITLMEVLSAAVAFLKRQANDFFSAAMQGSRPGVLLVSLSQQALRPLGRKADLPANRGRQSALARDDLELRKVLEPVIDQTREPAALRPARDTHALNNPPRPHNTSTAMSLSCRHAAQCCARQMRSAASFRSTAALAQQRITRRYQSTDAAAAPTNPKIAGIVDQISQLTLLETADLVSSLKVGSESAQARILGRMLTQILTIVATQHPRFAHWRIRCCRSRCCTGSCRGRGGGTGCRPGEDVVCREADVVRRQRQAKGHQGNQELVGIESGGLQEVCRERAQVDEGLSTKGRG